MIVHHQRKHVLYRVCVPHHKRKQVHERTHTHTPPNSATRKITRRAMSDDELDELETKARALCMHTFLFIKRIAMRAPC